MAIKYPRTPHFPWSEGATKDDRILTSVDHFIGQEVVITEKMDGENTTMMKDKIYARSLDSVDHLSRHWVKGLWGRICFEIPEGWRICGENLYAQHSLIYDQLESYFYVFSIWNDDNVCLSFDETLEWCQLLDLVHVKVLWKGQWDEEFIKGFPINKSIQEGYVIRVTRSFAFQEFDKCLAKFVRKGHVQSEEHWLDLPLVPNRLKK